MALPRETSMCGACGKPINRPLSTSPMMIYTAEQLMAEPDPPVWTLWRHDTPGAGHRATPSDWGDKEPPAHPWDNRFGAVL